MPTGSGGILLRFSRLIFLCNFFHCRQSLDCLPFPISGELLFCFLKGNLYLLNQLVMGDLNVRQKQSKEDLKIFKQHLFRDIRAMETMLERGMFEEGITRIGAEQELVLVDKSFRPAPIAPELLKELDATYFTNELSKFNVEINLDPLEFKGGCLSKMEKQLLGCLDHLDKKLEKYNSDYAMVGILPTIRRKDLSLENLTPIPRYFALNDAMRQMRGGSYEFRMEGTDELITQHDTLMMESCNTSFQVHYQVSVDDFVAKYNWAQAIAGPVLAVCTNSPLLFNHRLWRETRIALFQQSADIRRNSLHEREKRARVFFGGDWVRESVMDLFREEVARYRVLISSEITEDAFETLENGGIPKLRALRMHTGTIYTWMRACYGITDGKPHLRIENRVLPSGPSVIDEMANTAFWLGLMHGMPEKYRNIKETVDFDLVKGNFNRAAKVGMGMMFRWIDNQVYTAQELVLKELLPIAEEGLKKAKIKKEDIDRYLGVIRERTETGMGGSQWMLDSYEALKKKGNRDEAVVATTAAMVNRQRENTPVHTWDIAGIHEAGSWKNRYWQIGQFMSRDLYTVQEEDLVDLIPNIMIWKNLQVLPVEDEDGVYVGLVFSHQLLNHYATRLTDKTDLTVGDIMVRDIPSVTEETLTTDAISLLRQHNLHCLPVVTEKGKLVGIVTETDFMNVADHFLKEIVGEQKTK